MENQPRKRKRVRQMIGGRGGRGSVEWLAWLHHEAREPYRKRLIQGKREAGIQRSEFNRLSENITLKGFSRDYGVSISLNRQNYRSKALYVSIFISQFVHLVAIGNPRSTLKLERHKIILILTIIDFLICL
jgi:hypothetical protein